MASERKRPSFAEAAVGEGFTAHYRLTPELVREYCGGVDEPLPWRAQGPPLEAASAPPALLFFMHTRVVGERFDLAGRVDTRHEAQFLRPVPVGSTVTVTMRVEDRFQRRGREYVVVEYRSLDEDGRLLCRDRNRVLVDPSPKRG